FRPFPTSGGFTQTYPSFFGGLDPYLSPLPPPQVGGLSPLGPPPCLAASPAGFGATPAAFGGTPGLGFGECLELKEPGGAWKVNLGPGECLELKEQSGWRFQVL
ncbi:cone-rod homeobox protein-like, partial [Pyrgilauda ruficollis]|uniref:cone-rod homeobox protein-like n=1 Tax=Pyrgilauda ruficollis TaxID=221976 RepID=UPI001B881FAF